jgi:hypothetical protein
VTLDQVPESPERAKALPSQQAAPVHESRPHSDLGTIIPDHIELLLEHVRDLEAAIEPEHLVELTTVTPVETAALLEQK